MDIAVRISPVVRIPLLSTSPPQAPKIGGSFAPKALFHPLPLIPIGGFGNFLIPDSTRRDIYEFSYEQVELDFQTRRFRCHGCQHNCDCATSLSDNFRTTKALRLWGRWEHASLRLDISLLAGRGGERSEIRSIILQPAFGASVPSRHGSSRKLGFQSFERR